MARNFAPSAPFNVRFMLLKPSYSSVAGVAKKSYPKPDDGEPFNGSFRTFGGTELDSNGVYTIEDTATIDTWYRPDIKVDCRVYVCDTAQTYEIIGTPENIDMRNQFLGFKVRRVGGRA